MKLYIENGQAHPAIQVLPNPDPAPSGYTLSIDPNDYELYAKQAGINEHDYKWMKKRMRQLYNNQTWSTMTDVYKKCYARHKVATPSERDEVYPSYVDQLVHGKLYDLNSTAARRTRWRIIKNEIHNRLTKAQKNTVMTEIGNLARRYINKGVEGTIEGDPEGLFDYMEGRTGTSYDGIGFADHSYTPKPNGDDYADMPSFTSYLMDVLKDGI